MDRAYSDKLNRELSSSSPEDILSYFTREFSGSFCLSTSMGPEDQILTHMLAKLDPSIPIFTLDTGRMFPETYDLIHRTNQRYGIHIQIYFPDHHEVERMVGEKGINLFYESIANRKECCFIRKILPLRRALSGMDAWVCGLRKEQSVTRENVQAVEWDDANGLVKVNPLHSWTSQMVWDYIHQHQVPYNTLHDQGFASIGCQPCTRAIMEGEDERAGRWWWENPESRECGLHVKDH